VNRSEKISAMLGEAKSMAKDGMLFPDALKLAKKGEKIIYGTNSNAWHVVGSDDRDYNTSFAIDPKQAKKDGEDRSRKKSLAAYTF